MPALRSAGWVAALSLLASAVLASPAPPARAAGAGSPPARSAGCATSHPASWLLMAASLRAAGERRLGRVGPAARGAALAALLLAIFVPLFVTADAAFAEIVGDAFAWDLSADRTADRVAIFVLVAGLAGALALTAATPATAAGGPRTPLLGRTEWRIALTVLDVLFAAFVVLQLATLFGGDEHVLRTAGLTYAEYAREGFAQLMAVAALTLAVIALARRDDRVLRVLLGLLCALTLVVLASALKRLGLYEEAFGFTRLRLLAHGGIFWLAGLFVLVLAAGAARSATWLPRATVALSALIGLAFGLSNPDARIAEHNIARYERTGEIDLHHLAHLSPDAAPALARLPAPLAGGRSGRRGRRCGRRTGSPARASGAPVPARRSSAAERPLVDVPGRRRGVRPRPARRRGRGPLDGLGGGDEAGDVARLHEGGAAVEHLAQRRAVGGDHRRPARERLDRGQPEALVRRRQQERVRAGVEGGQLVVVDVAGDDHARQLARPLARRAHEHERELARRVDERGHAPVRIGVAQVADPQQVVLRHAVALAHGRDLLRRARG